MRPSCSSPGCGGAGCGGTAGFTVVTGALVLLRGGALSLALELLTRFTATCSETGGVITAALSRALEPVQPAVMQTNPRRSKPPRRLNLLCPCWGGDGGTLCP